MSKDERGKRRLATIENYKEIFNTPGGKRVLWDLMQEHYVIAPTFDGCEALEMAYREGQRNVVLRILQLMKIDVRKLAEALEEREKEQTNS